MRLLIIGQAVVDTIEFINGKTLLLPGGVHHVCVGISIAKSDNDELFLCTSFDDESKLLFEKSFSIFNDKYITKADRIPRVHLTIYPDREREEKYDSINQNLQLNIYDWNNFDGILLNMITGFDVTLEQAEYIRNNFQGIIYLDVHTLSRGLDEHFNRNFRLIPNIEKWSKSVDIIQMNENEIETVSKLKSEGKIVEELFNYGIKIILITKGAAGVRVYYKNKTETSSLFISSLKINAVNTVGCGDVFGAVFFYNYIKTKNINLALHKAVQAASLTAAGLTPNEIKNYS
jgi:sugar/nucleoside kinase (ribokinase family)